MNTIYKFLFLSCIFHVFANTHHYQKIVIKGAVLRFILNPEDTESDICHNDDKNSG